MRTLRTHTTSRLTLAALLLAVPVVQAGETAGLWITDDTEKVVFHTTLGGSVITSFDEVSGANSAIDVDPDGSLWGVDESPAEIVNFSRDGEYISSFSGSSFGASALEGVGVDPDGTLWVINDPKSGGEPSVFHLTKDGDLLDEFETSEYDGSSVSPQDISVDPDNGTLWIGDNSSDKVYNITRSGSLISEMDTDEFGGPGNIQGLCVAPDGTIWATARDTGEVYNFTKSGSLIDSFDAPDGNPTGVAFDPDRKGTGGGDPWESLGGGTSGDNGEPLLVMTGPLTSGSTIGLELTDGADDALAVVFISFDSSPGPFLGGTLHALPVDALAVLFTDGSGDLSISSVLPSASTGDELYFQVGVEDPSVPIYGASLSNAVLGTAP